MHIGDRKIFNKQDPPNYIMGGEKIDNNEFVLTLKKNIDFELKQKSRNNSSSQFSGKSTLLKNIISHNKTYRRYCSR
jgi:hypothetical protein